MIELGMRQTLYLDHKTDFGVYLCEENNLGKKNAECVLLPGKQVPAEQKKGDPIDVFV